MPKLQQLPNQQFIITLPRQLVMAKGWVKGDLIKIELDKSGNFVLKKES